jgi:recombination protein RecT
MTNAVAVHQEVGIVKAVEASLWAREETIRAILPDSMDLRRFVKTTMIALSKNPDLQKCTQESIVRSIIEAASVGLEPTGMLNRAWLVPYNNKKKDANGKEYWENEAQLAIGYEGLIDLSRRSGEVRKVTARVVYEGDEFTVIQGTEERLEHTPAFLTEDPLKITLVYCIVTYRDGTTQHEIMSRKQVDGVRAKAKAKNAMAWTDSYPEMARKTVVRRAMKYLPLTPEVIEAVARDDEREFGTPTVAAAIGPRASSLRESIKAQAEEIEGKVIEIPAVEITEVTNRADGILNVLEVNEGGRAMYAASAPEPTAAEPQPTKCGSLSDPALGEIEECSLAPDHLKETGSRRRHRAASGSVWPA